MKANYNRRSGNKSQHIPVKVQKQFGQELRRKREELGFNQKDFAESLDMFASDISKIENGKANLGMDRAVKICACLGVSFDELAKGEELRWQRFKECGRRIRRLRSDRGLTVTAFAVALGLTDEQVTFLEKGESNLVETKAERIAKILGTTKEYILEGKEPEEEKPEDLLPKKEDPATSEKPVVAETTKTSARIPFEVIDVVIKHVKDLNVSEDIQRKVFRAFMDYQTALKEESLFGGK